MTIVKGLTAHTVVVCVDKHERGIPLQQLLQKLGYRAVVTASMYDALKVISQEMPHLVVCEALLSDGNAGNLYDRLQQNATLKRTPVLVNVLKKSKEELVPLQGRKVAGILVGPLQPAAFVAKVKEIFDKHDDSSPHFVYASNLSMTQDVTLSLQAQVMGCANGHLVSKSATEVDSAAALVCLPENSSLGPVLMGMGSNLADSDGYYNLFPVSRIKGKGRKWVAELPEIELTSAAEAGPSAPRKVLFFDPNPERFKQFKDILSGYEMELIGAHTMQQAAAYLKRDPKSFGCAYLHELVLDATSAAWREAYNSIPANDRPVLVVGTSNIKARSTVETRYLKRPFGVGVLVETIEAAFERGDAMTNMMQSSTNKANIPVSYQAPAKLLGLDETGGILQLRFPIVKGSKVYLLHRELKTMWGDISVSIVSTGPVPEKPDVWQARFETVAAGTSKAKYWEKVVKFLDEHRIEESAPTPTSATAASAANSLEKVA